MTTSSMVDTQVLSFALVTEAPTDSKLARMQRDSAGHDHRLGGFLLARLGRLIRRQLVDRHKGTGEQAEPPLVDPLTSGR